MQHPDLGLLEADPNRQGAYTGAIQHDGRAIGVFIEADGGPEADALASATRAVKELEAIDGAAKRIIARDLLSTYNDGWRSYDEPQPDGTYQAVDRPELSADEFANGFELESLIVRGEMWELGYRDREEYFWGHAILVISFGGSIDGAHAEMFG